MKKLLYLNILLIGLIFTGCPVKTDKTDELLEYNNILIYSDLSSRMEKSPNDTVIIGQLIDYFRNECVKPGIKVNDRSSISFSRINYFKSKCSSVKIDIGEIKSLEEKQSFVNDKSKNGNLSDTINNFKNVVKCNYKEHDFGGLDILSLIYNEINSGNIVKKPSQIIGENDTTKINYHNHLFIFTDGYLEYDKDNGNNQFFFGEPQIENLRQYCIKNHISLKDAIKNKPGFKLRPLKSEYNQLVNLYVLETYDRGLDIESGTLKNTGELSDNNILKTIWQVWAEESGFKGFVWKPLNKQASMSNDFIKNLIQNQN